MNHPVVSFDECGNTGANLLDSEQPCFVLASVHLSHEESREILRPILSDSREEVHFSQQKRTKAGQQQILGVLGSPLLTTANAKISIVDKSYMVTTKLVDLLIENLAFREGIDLYQQQEHVCLANLLHMCIPEFCGPERFQRIQKTFVEMIRRKTNAAIMDFYASVADARDNCSSSSFVRHFDVMTATRGILRDHLEGWRHTELDPAVPCLIADSALWSDQLGAAFSIAHDRSKPIAFEQGFIESLMEPDGADTRVGNGQQSIPLFIKCTGIDLVDSKASAPIQVADILAGAACAIFSAHLGVIGDQDFVHSIHQCFNQDLIGTSIWPTGKVTPEELESDGTFKAADLELIGEEIAKRMYIDSSGRPKKRR